MSRAGQMIGNTVWCLQLWFSCSFVFTGMFALQFSLGESHHVVEIGRHSKPGVVSFVSSDFRLGEMLMMCAKLRRIFPCGSVSRTSQKWRQSCLSVWKRFSRHEQCGHFMNNWMNEVLAHICSHLLCQLHRKELY